MPVTHEGRRVYASPDALNGWLGRESAGEPVQIATDTADLSAELNRGLVFVRKQRRGRTSKKRAAWPDCRLSCSLPIVTERGYPTTPVPLTFIQRPNQFLNHRIKLLGVGLVGYSSTQFPPIPLLVSSHSAPPIVRAVV